MIVQHNEYIELPKKDVWHLTRMFKKAPIEEIKKHGHKFQNELLSKAPIQFDKKYISVYAYPLFLMPELRVSPTDDWVTNIDDFFVREVDRVHLFISQATASIEFKNGFKYEPNKFVTFSKDFHKFTPSSRPELVYYFMVIESDDIQPNPLGRTGHTTVYKDGRKVPNLIQKSDMVMMNLGGE